MIIINLTSKSNKYNLGVTISKRFMLSRSGLNISDVKHAMSLHNKQQVAKSALNFSKLIVNREFVHNIGNSAKQNIANEQTAKGVYDYVSDTNAGGTSTIKTNFIASFIHNNKELMYPYTYLKDNIRNPRIKFDASLANKTAPSRTLVELPIINNFVDRMPQIKEATILGDNVPFNFGTKNVNPDFKVTFSNSTERGYDVKTTNLDTHVFSGNIREIAFTDMQMVTYPRDTSNLGKQYSRIEAGLIAKNEYFKNNMPKENYASFWDNFINFQQLIRNPQPLLEKHSRMENALMEIAQNPYFNSNFNFYNIYHIKNGLLTPDEMRFLEEAINHVDSNLLTKSSYMNQYLITCLHIYHKNVNPLTYETLKPLRKVYPFIKELLKNYIGNDG